MPRAPRHCRADGCTILVRTENFCPQHKPPPWRGPRTRSSKLTSTAPWKRLADEVKRRDGYQCQIRTPGICTGHASTVDKIVPVSRRPDLAMNPSNLRAACSKCNEHKGRTTDRMK